MRRLHPFTFAMILALHLALISATACADKHPTGAPTKTNRASTLIEGTIGEPSKASSTKEDVNFFVGVMAAYADRRGILLAFSYGDGKWHSRPLGDALAHKVDRWTPIIAGHAKTDVHTHWTEGDNANLLSLTDDASAQPWVQLPTGQFERQIDALQALPVIATTGPWPSGGATWQLNNSDPTVNFVQIAANKFGPLSVCQGTGAVTATRSAGPTDIAVSMQYFNQTSMHLAFVRIMSPQLLICDLNTKSIALLTDASGNVKYSGPATDFVGDADFNSDGASEIILYNANGAIDSWILIDGKDPSQAVVFPSIQ